MNSTKLQTERRTTPAMMHHQLTKKRRRRQLSTAASSSAWLLSLLQLCCSNTAAPLAQAAQHQQSQEAQLASSSSQSTYLRKSRRRQSSSNNISYFSFSPSDDATIYSTKTALLSNYDTHNQLIFTGNDALQKLNALLKFDLTFINHKSSSELNSATLHLCNSFDSGGAFDPHGVNVYGVSASYFSGGGDWSESTVRWDHSPQVNVGGGKAEFVESHTDENCFWHTFSVTSLIRSALDDSSMMRDLTLRITGKEQDEYVGMYASKEFKEGKASPRLDIYFGQEDTDSPSLGPTQPQPLPTTAQPTYPKPIPAPTTVPPTPVPTTPPRPTPQVFYACSFNDETVPDWSSKHIYGAADLVTNYDKVYQCKPHPFSGWCNDYEPGVQSSLPGSGGVSIPWRDAWVEKANCVEMMYTKEAEVLVMTEEEEGHLTGSKFTSTSSSVYDSELCATPKYREGDHYAAQDQVLYQDGVYECNELGWCSTGGYQPGLGMYWEMAWSLLHESLGCPDIPDPTSMPTLNPTIAKEICAPRYSAETEYKMFDTVSHENYNYRCHVERWCNDGNGLNAAAWWQTSKPCEMPPTLQPTNHPTLHPTKGVVTRPPKTTTSAPTTSAPTTAAPTLSNQCSPPYTVGHPYKFMEEISFNYYNYACYVPDKCTQIKYAPRLADENVGVAWWKTDACVGSQTRHPTVLPTPKPTYPQREESVHSIAHDEFYTSALPEGVAKILEKSKTDIEQNVLVRRTPNLEWEVSSIYHYEGLLKALGVMTLHNVRSGNFYLGEGMGDVEARYGLVNTAAFLAHSMAQSIKHDICDEPNWEQVNGKYPLSNACGQGGKSYQDMTCPVDEKHMECPVKTTMATRAVTHSNWGTFPGAPTHLFCQPKSTDGSHFTGFWDHKYKCDRPYGEPPEFCDVYEGQTAGRIDNSVPAANMAARIDVEGCCWWGRGVIQTKGVCSIGRLNYFLGKGAADAGRPSPYPKIDFCEDPEVICGSAQYAELKWVAGMTEWVDQVQAYDKDDYSYLDELKRFVNGGMTDDAFIMNISKILQHGCHGDDTRCHAADGAWERMDNFKRVLKLFRLEVGEEVVVAASSSSSTATEADATSSVYLSSSRLTPSPTSRSPSMYPTRSPKMRPTPLPSPRVTRPPPPTSPMPTVEPDSPTVKPTPQIPWYVNYDLLACVNDGKQADWVDQDSLYGTKEMCCGKYFTDKHDYLACISISGGSASDGDNSRPTEKPQPKQELEEAEEELQVSGCPPHASGWHSSPNCKSYFMCKKGIQFGTAMACEEGFLFEKKSNSCRSDVKCGSLLSQSQPLPPPPRPTPTPMSFSSSEYHSKTRPNT